MDEFSLIEKYFKNQKISRPDVLLGIGDDAALVSAPLNCLLVLSIDTLIEGIHFTPQTLPLDIGHKALAVNLSDLAAMGAEPAWLTLALTLPEVNTQWLDGFTSGLYQLANQFNMQLIGGDTTRGPLTVTIQAHGFVPPHQALCRHGAKVGDKIYVSGTLGDAGLGLQVALNNRNIPIQDKLFVLQRLNKPTPRIQLGILLREIATSAIDISDGLLADLNHILKSSHVGAQITAKNLPLSRALQRLPLAEAQKLSLTAGDDYELCFTIPPENEKELMTRLSHLEINCCCIGEIEAEPGLRISGFSGDLSTLGFQHFYR
ncbi:MAG TPA: thiamine-phosphate kinase [Gammaproteobacteria bacterium]|nr:thiamine-phosphate kinase [Gammaproteobacteria bacterium]